MFRLATKGRNCFFLLEAAWVGPRRSALQSAEQRGKDAMSQKEKIGKIGQKHREKR